MGRGRWFCWLIKVSELGESIFGSETHNKIIDGNSRAVIHWVLPALGTRPFKPLLEGRIPLNRDGQFPVAVKRCITISPLKQHNQARGLKIKHLS
jgi:hypothetical protein